MTREPEELDRVVSRRVDHRSAASPADERAYAAADGRVDPEPDTADGGPGGTAERAARDLAGQEPERSE